MNIPSTIWHVRGFCPSRSRAGLFRLFGYGERLLQRAGIPEPKGPIRVLVGKARNTVTDISEFLANKSRIAPRYQSKKRRSLHPPGLCSVSLGSTIRPPPGSSCYQIIPSSWPILSITFRSWVSLTHPNLVASAASMVAIFAVRITDATGNPARARAVMGTSLDHPRFSALVIITTQIRLWASRRLADDTTRAGRECLVERSV